MDQEKLENLIQKIKEENPTNGLIFEYLSDNVEVSSIESVEIENDLLKCVSINEMAVKYVDIDCICGVVVKKD